MRLSGIALVVASAVALQFAGIAQAAEPTLPADVQKCYDNAVATPDIIECSNKEAEYWDKVLNENYKIAMQSCTKIAQDYYEGAEQKDFEAKCKKKLKSTQLTWLKYRDGMADVQCELSPNYRGTMQQLECASAYTTLVKEQALKLWYVYANDKLWD